MTVQADSFRDAYKKVREKLKERYGERFGYVYAKKTVLLSTFKEIMIEEMEDKKRRAAEYLERLKKRNKNGNDSDNNR